MPGIRATREQLDDRFSVLGFNVKTERQPYFEVTIGTEPRLFQADQQTQRTPANFFSSGLMQADRGEAVYLIPTEVLSRFVGQPRLYFGLATFSAPDRSQGQVIAMPTEGSPYVSLKAFTGRSLRRLMGLPNQRVAGNGYGTVKAGDLIWAGDAAKPGLEAVPVAAPVKAAPAPAYAPVSSAPVAPPPMTPAANAAAFDYDDGLDPNLWTKLRAVSASSDGQDDYGIDGPVPDGPATAGQQAYGRPLTAAEYPQASRFEPASASNYRATVAGSQRTINRIVIHITDGGPNINGPISWFQNPAAQVSAHYIVGQNGEVVQMVMHKDVAWHAHRANTDSIGIEHVANSGNGRLPRLMPTDAEYCASAALVSWLCDQFGIPKDRDHIQGHAEADPSTSHSACPNAVWNWDYFMSMVRDNACYPMPTSQGLALRRARALADEASEAEGIDFDIDDAYLPVAAQSYARPLTDTPDYAGASQFVAARWFQHKTEARTIQRVVIHITAGRNTQAINTAHYFEDPTRDRRIDEEDGQLQIEEADGRLVRFRSRNKWYDSFDGRIRTQNGRSLGRTRVKVSAHYVVGQAGDIVQCVHDNDVAWHASAANADSIGIEHCGSNTYNNPPVQAQYEASAQLVCWLCRQYGIPIDRDHIVGHFEASPQDNHDCPSPAWEWDTYMQIVNTYAAANGGAAAQGLAYARRSAPRARSLADECFNLRWQDVELVPQPTGMSCWAAAASMIVGWRDRISINPEEVANGTGVWGAYQHGLYPRDHATLADAWRLVKEPPQSYSLDGFRALLENNGPLWVGVAVPSGHAVVVTGMACDGAPDGSDTTVHILDPWPPNQGSEYDQPWTQFVQQYEDRLTVHNGNVNIQILHAGGTDGRRMSIPGMAQGLAAARAGSAVARRSPPRARALSGPPAIFYDVALIPQPDKLSCWAASMAMLLGFHQRQSVTPQSLAEQVGRNLRTSYGWDMLEAVKDQFGFQVISLPSNASLYPSPQDWYDWLSNYGPLWVTTIGAPSHAIVVHGISGDLTPAGTTLSILNPWDTTQAFDADPIDFNPFNAGRAYSQAFEAFASDFGNLGLANYGEWRVLHLPGSNVPNAAVSQTLARGQSRAAGPRPNGRAKQTFARARQLGIADIPAVIPDGIMTRVQDSSGRISWELDQLRGVKHPSSQVPMPAVVKPLLDARTIRLEDWPCVESGTERIQAAFTVDWQYDGQSLGNIRIANTAVMEAADWSLHVRAIIADDAADYPPGAPQYAALNVTFEYQFTRTDGSAARATTELKLFGNGTFNQTSRWAQ